jgi:hypothetical protein
LLIEAGTLDAAHRQRLEEYASSGVEVVQTDSLPTKVAVFDGTRGLLGLLNTVIHAPGLHRDRVRTRQYGPDRIEFAPKQVVGEV